MMIRNGLHFLRSLSLPIVACASALSAAPLSAQGLAACGSLENHYGPFDYRTSYDKHAIVERFHFTPDVEHLRRGQSTTRIGGDISYVLRVFPNHPRALDAMARLSEREKRSTPGGSTYSIDCWFERGMRFRPDDESVKMLYGMHLLRVGKAQEAVRYLEQARKSGQPNANIHYNLGLAYMRLGRHDAALENAHIAYGMGFPLPGLRNQLVRAGKWRDPRPAPAAPAAAPVADSPPAGSEGAQEPAAAVGGGDTE